MNPLDTSVYLNHIVKLYMNGYKLNLCINVHLIIMEL